MAKFIIENNEAIWGTGDTAEAAWLDMERHIDTTENYSRDDFRCCEATDELIAEVAERGGAISWGELPDGTRCTNAQELAADEAA